MGGWWRWWVVVTPPPFPCFWKATPTDAGACMFHGEAAGFRHEAVAVGSSMYKSYWTSRCDC